jgi:hypothetical protein
MPLVTRALWSVVAALSLVLSYGGWLDARGAAHVDQALQRALVSFALARTLSGVLSVVEDTQISLQPAGVGVTLAPGEILDPLNDLIERFSWVLLASSAALGVERVLLSMSGWWGVNLALEVAAVLALGATWLGGVSERWRRALTRVLLTMVFLRFAIPVLLVATQLISATFLDQQASTATQALQTTSDEARTLSQQPDDGTPAAQDQSTLERLGAAVSGTFDLEQRVHSLRTRLSEGVQHIIDLIVVYTLETVLIPLAILWLLINLLRTLLGAGLRSAG